jgi:hypothetical protein
LPLGSTYTVTISRADIIQGLREKGVHIPGTSPTIKKHNEAFIASGELTDIPGPADTMYQINSSPVLKDYEHLTASMHPTSQGFTHLTYHEPAAYILEKHACRTHPNTDNPEVILRKHVRNLYRRLISTDFINLVIAGEKEAKDIPQTVIREPFRGKEIRAREAIHVSLVEYTILRENLYHYLLSPEGKQWLIDTLIQ